jgi:hypothetical protein
LRLLPSISNWAWLRSATATGRSTSFISCRSVCYRYIKRPGEAMFPLHDDPRPVTND